MPVPFPAPAGPTPPAVSPAPVIVHWAGEALELLPDRALWWPAQAVLFVADVHLGKAATFRALGQPVPAGTTAANLARLDGLLTARPVRHLVVLGDLLHAAPAHNAALLEQVAQWRMRHADLAITLVRGNHDDRAGDPPAHLGIAVVGEPWLLGPFACCHEPQSHGTHFVLAGHVHPACWLQGPGRDRLRLPCFTQQGRGAVLPAFGEFTGGWTVDAADGLARYAVGGGGVWPLP
ncbi:MAG: ligase-associated DNA damage response endonuclease PdeM [Burkholderiaceae bacterium]|nr:ligase-associated DNA damage response endonuclease PdeM [Burkholderiaceae bacterium]